MIIVVPNATEFNLARANPSSLLNMSKTTQMLQWVHVEADLAD